MEQEVHTFMKQQYVIKPKSSIYYSLTESSDTACLPHQVDNGILKLRSPIEIHIASGRTILMRSGLKLNVPETIDIGRVLNTDAPSVATGRLNIMVHVGSVFERLVTEGLTAIGPQVVTPSEVNQQELVVCLFNAGRDEIVIKKGDYYAELYLSVSPDIKLLLV